MRTIAQRHAHAALDRLEGVLLLPRVANANVVRLPRETLTTLRGWLR